MENQSNQSNPSTQSLKSVVEEILKNADDEVINCFFQAQGIEPYCGKFYYKGQEETYNQLIQAGITAEFADQYGGEDKGDKYWTVYKFYKGNESVYVQFDGWYASYSGSEFNECFFVEPKEVKVVEFHRCK